MSAEGLPKVFSRVLLSTCLQILFGLGKSHLIGIENQRDLCLVPGPGTVPAPNSQAKKCIIDECVSFLKLLQQITTNLVTKNNINLFSHTSESQKSEVSFTEPTARCWQNHAPFRGSREDLAPLRCQHSWTCGCIIPISPSWSPCFLLLCLCEISLL